MIDFNNNKFIAREDYNKVFKTTGKLFLKRPIITLNTVRSPGH